MGLVNTNLPTNPFGSRVSGCALEGGVTVGSRLVLLLCAVFMYCTILKTFIQVFKAKTPIPIVRQENVQEVHWTDFPKIKKKNHFLFYRKHLTF